NAWRIIVVGTAPDMRGRGIAADLYRVLMRDRTLVARIAVDNHASIRLHRSVGWRLYPDGDVVLAVHERCGECPPSGGPHERPAKAGRYVRGCCYPAAAVRASTPDSLPTRRWLL